MTYDIIIIGAGIGGYTAAIEAAKKGQKVAMIEKKHIGGTCLNYGCIPTKTYLSLGSSFQQGKDYWGVGNYHIDRRKIAETIREKIEKLRKGLQYTLNQYTISIYQGEAELLDKHQICVHQGNKEVFLDAKYIILATGSKSKEIDIPGIASPNVITVDNCFIEKNIAPDSIVLLGGGVVGIEFAYLLCLFGSNVTIIDNQPYLLANIVSKELSSMVEFYLQQEGVMIYKNAEVQEIEEEDEELIITFQNTDGVKQILSQKMLLAAGRIANLEIKGIKKVGVEIENGSIRVNKFFQTSVDNIFAIGDVASIRQFAYVAGMQGEKVVSYIIGDNVTSIKENELPSCVFIHPEIAVIGINEDEAKRRKINYKSSKVMMSVNGRSVLEGKEKGYVRVVADADKDIIIGAELFCENAADMIMLIETFIRYKVRLRDVVDQLFPHPTYVEIIREAVKRMI